MENKWCNLSQLSIQERSKKEYYVIVKKTILKLLSPGNCTRNITTVIPGMLLEAVKIDNSDALRVKIYNNDNLGNNTEWKCHPIDVLRVSEFIWRCLCPISSFEERLRLAENKQLCNDVENLKIDSKVWFCPGHDESIQTNRFETYSASITYIGDVPELGDGYFFGLNLDKQDVYKPEPFIAKTPSGCFATLSNIQPKKYITNVKKNFVLNHDLLQATKINNLFNITNEEIHSIKKTSNDFQNKKYLLQVDNDNNNQASETNNPNNYNFTNDCYPEKNKIHQQQSDNKKLYRNLKSFDPLNSDEEVDEASANVQQISKSDYLSVGSCVKVLIHTEICYGVIRWIGIPQVSKSKKLMAAVELDDSHPLATDGTYQDVRYLQTAPQKVWFTDLEKCDQYDMAASSCYYRPEIKNVESIHTSFIGRVAPPISVKDDLNKFCGKFRGIQGHHNSCYLDATLFSMFAFTNVFDNLLIRPPNENDCPQYQEVQTVLREEIVNPLRTRRFVEANRVMKLRTLLEKSSSISGLTSEEKDPEEFLTSLVAQTLNAEPFLKLSSGQDAYHYQLFVEKDDKLILPTVQQLLEQSFVTSNVRLNEVPSCLIIQMPRFGKSYKMYSRIQPTLLLDVTDIIQDSLRQCTVCGKLANFECKDCYGQCGKGLESTAFCEQCLKKKVHCHEKRRNHNPKPLHVPVEYELGKEVCTVPRLYMELLAVVCIETSHYVSFVKCAPGSDAPWCFFDSMADRKGEQNGYNIPEMVPCPDFPHWLSEEGAEYLVTVKDDRLLPEYAKRLFCDAYMCMYQSPNIMMYK